MHSMALNLLFVQIFFKAIFQKDSIFIDIFLQLVKDTN